MLSGNIDGRYNGPELIVRGRCCFFICSEFKLLTVSKFAFRQQKNPPYKMIHRTIRFSKNGRRL